MPEQLPEPELAQQARDLLLEPEEASLREGPGEPVDVPLHAHQRNALASAILSSLWAPVIYYPLNLWWEKMNVFEPS